MPDDVMVIDASGSGAPPEVRPPTPEEIAEKEAIVAAEAARIVYVETRNVSARARTTDATPTEVFRFPCEQERRYRADLRISGIAEGTFVSRDMEGRFVWKRTTGNAIMVGITIVSTLGEAASGTWAPNAAVSGTDVVFTVAGAAGVTIDWDLRGQVEVYAPGGLEG